MATSVPIALSAAAPGGVFGYTGDILPAGVTGATGMTGSTGMDPNAAYQEAFSPGGVAASLGALTGRANLNALNYDTELANQVNATNLAAQNALNVGNLPGGAGLQQQGASDVSAELAGQLAPGTVSMIEDEMAQRYGAGGFAPDSAAISAAAERAMGLTAEQQVQAGITNLGALNQMYPRPTLYGVQSGFVTPGDIASLASRQASDLMGGAGAGPGTTRGTGGTTTGGGGGGGSSIPSGGYPSSTGGYGGGYPGPTPGQAAGGMTGTRGMTTGTAGYQVQDPTTGQMWVQNSDGSWTNPATGQMQQYPPDIAYTYYDPGTDTVNYDYGLGMGDYNLGTTYYDPTSGATPTPVSQSYWLGGGNWTDVQGAPDYGAGGDFYRYYGLGEGDTGGD